jgi:patatin-related protein
MPDRSIEIRVALVLYGGVSLAVYENGVTRCFHDLVRGRGIFAVLLDLLDASATVDVIAGTSAGGINGLILAACLESGQDFASTADLWRRLGDVGALLRDVRDSQDAESLLDGEGYYQRSLIATFQQLCRLVRPDYESPGEIDVFITGTDIDGHPRQYVDGLGADVTDKEHRTVFHLQHRPGRKSLGFGAAKDTTDPVQQGIVLGAIARITSSFPIAFPPFRATDIASAYGEAAAAVLRTALQQTSDVDDAGGATYVDGGVLDNKPFGPALRAIFHRMPNGPVDRYLFYVEPDPVRYSQAQGRHPPMEVGLASLSSLPSYQSIAGNLDELKSHNERIRWMLGIEAELRRTRLPRPATPSPVYLHTRIDALARGLVLDAEVAPAAGDAPSDRARAELVARLAAALRASLDGDLARLDRWDANFQLRSAFHVLYDYYDQVKNGAASAQTTRAMQCAGRIVKALKLVRDFVSELRDQLLARPGSACAADELFDAVVRFLDGDAPHWQELRRALAVQRPLQTLSERSPSSGQDDGAYLPSEALSAVASAARGAATTLGCGPSPGGTQPSLRLPDASQKTILQHLAAALAEIVTSADGNSSRLDEFAALDDALYPLQFASGVYELDQIDFVRISPRDAQCELSEGDPHDKVAGDELAHFSAFLRRDWRTNDIIQGRLDGICQIVRTMLSDAAIGRALQRPTQLDAQLGVGALRQAEVMPGCPETFCAAVETAWKALRALGPRTAANADQFATACEAFRHSLIRAGQEQVIAEDFEGVLADQCYQEIAYGFANGRRFANAATAAQVIEREAAEAARAQLAEVPELQRSAAFRALKLGAEPIAGRAGRVPNSRIAEYGTQAYLHLWGMMRRSLGGSAWVLSAPQSRVIFRTPVRTLNAFSVLVRRERSLAAALAAAAFGVCGGILALWWFYVEHTWQNWRPVGGAFAGLLITGICVWLLSGVRRRRTPMSRWLSRGSALLAVALGALAAWWWYLDPHWPHWGAVGLACVWAGIAAFFVWRNA